MNSVSGPFLGREVMLEFHSEHEHGTPDGRYTRLSAAAQLHAWVESEAGQRLWQATGFLPPLDRICHTLNMIQAAKYGLLITSDFFTVFSTLQPQTFIRLADRYKITC